MCGVFSALKSILFYQDNCLTYFCCMLLHSYHEDMIHKTRRFDTELEQSLKTEGGFVAWYYNMSAAFTACLPSLSCMIVGASEIRKALKYLFSFTEYSRSVFKPFVDSARAGDVSSDLCFMQNKVMELVLMWVLLCSQICSFSG